MVSLKFCGPKLSLCCLILSVWGIVQLVMMGIFYHIQAVALLEDLPLGELRIENMDGINEFVAEAEAGYTQNATNCFIAACLYIITLLISAQQFYANNRSSVSM